MKLQSKIALTFVFAALLASTAAHAQVFSPLPPSVWPQVVPTPSASLIWQWLRDRNYEALWRLAKNEAIKAGMKEVQSYMKSPVKMTKLAAQLNAIFDDPALTPVQKYDRLIQLTDASFEASTSAPSSPLNITMKHSIEFGITRLEWDDKVRNGSQDAVRATGTCIGSTTDLNCSWSGRFSRCYYRAQPDYFIYRVVNGVTTQITTIKGYHESRGTQGFTFNDNLFKSAWNAARAYYDSLSGNYAAPPVANGRAFFYDFQADQRPPGSTLSYIVSTFDNWLFPVVDTDGDGYGDSTACGAATGSLNTGTAVADGNGDGRPDYLTNADYAKYWGKYNGWLPAVLNTLLD